MTDNEIIKALERCSTSYNCGDCPYYCNAEDCPDPLMNDALDLINRQKAEIERLNKNYEELIYKIEYLLCHATGNKFSKYTYTTQEMISFVDDYIQDCCDEAVEEAKEAVKSEAIKEFAERVKKELRLDDDCSYDCENCCFECKEFVPQIDNLVKEMTEE